jgi:hypothetical protein
MYVVYLCTATLGGFCMVSDLCVPCKHVNESVWMVPGTVNPMED